MPLITGLWHDLDEASATDPLHFAGTREYIDPITRLGVGQTTRQYLVAQGALRGWPLKGIYISSSGGGGLPHCCLHRLDFPTEVGGAAIKIAKLQDDLDAAFQFLYEEAVEHSRNNWVKAHVWTYRDDKLYVPRSPGNGDYAVLVSNNDPPATWWTELN